jgi:hypothetical protein
MFTELPGREARSTYRGGLAARPHRCWHPSSPAASRNTASCRYPPSEFSLAAMPPAVFDAILDVATIEGP